MDVLSDSRVYRKSVEEMSSQESTISVKVSDSRGSAEILIVSSLLCRGIYETLDSTYLQRIVDRG